MLGWAIYLDILRKPRYLNTLILTVLVSLATTFAALSSIYNSRYVLYRVTDFKGRGVLLSIHDASTCFSRVCYWFPDHST